MLGFCIFFPQNSVLTFVIEKKNIIGLISKTYLNCITSSDLCCMRYESRGYSCNIYAAWGTKVEDIHNTYAACGTKVEDIHNTYAACGTKLENIHNTYAACGTKVEDIHVTFTLHEVWK